MADKQHSKDNLIYAIMLRIKTPENHPQQPVKTQINLLYTIAVVSTHNAIALLQDMLSVLTVSGKFI